ncbi:toll/interleukin-1 receptor domain-containing protein [Streptomyces sp. NL15-2K]|uniref:toll/interleukin-1 receptor domain-containing protein n=1 Tax=Streptomyces sp. NL15-2K TaxID=376149 RepID=UPI00263BDCBE|nr:MULTISPECIES: toll/interleukin-1 receptor domain-containing protein [Actinomycetes]WKX07272.1 toll/interleukin-1 receptor domain-containing protein [Kutzneria buriramensis]
MFCVATVSDCLHAPKPPYGWIGYVPHPHVRSSGRNPGNDLRRYGRGRAGAAVRYGRHFISYRRGDHQSVVDGLYEGLARHFGAEQVFLDRLSIVPGQRFPDVLREWVADCDVLLVVVHRGWVDVRGESSDERWLDDAEDWGRWEIEQALHSGKTVIPLLLDGAHAPLSEQLPESLSDLARRNAQYLREARHGADMAELIAVLESHVTRTWQPVPAPPSSGVRRPGRWLGAGTAVSALAILLGVPAIPWDDGWVGTDEPPFTLVAAVWSFW